MGGIDINPAVFGAYAFYGGILLVKLLAMVPLTAKQRFTKKVFMNPEDTPLLPGSKIKFDDPDVERIRRCHLNDMENIFPFLAIAFLYCFTSPAIGTAKLLFQVFTVARILHTIVYAIIPLPQPARFLAFTVGMGVNVYMVFKVITHFA